MARILVIDDDAPVRTTIRLLLERQGHAVVVAADGASGLAALDAGEFELLIVDIFMPGMDGLETIRGVHSRKPELPVIVISGSSFRGASGPAPDFLAMAVKLGAGRSIQKPFKPHELIAAVEQCLARLLDHRQAATR